MRDNTNEIVSIEMFCEHSRITDLYDEIVVQQCLDAAHDAVEHWLNRPLYPSQIVGIINEIQPVVFLPNPTVRNVLNIVAEDETFADVTLLENTHWKFDYITESVRFINNDPNIRFDKLSQIRIKYDCGYDPDCDPVPPAVVHAILMTAATLYENREDTIVGTQINSVPLDAQRLIRIHRRRTTV